MFACPQGLSQEVRSGGFARRLVCCVSQAVVHGLAVATYCCVGIDITVTLVSGRGLKTW